MAEEQQQLEIEVEPEIEIVDDTPESDKGKPEPRGEVEVTDDEISQYSENVQKRIRQLRAGYHEERREKERLLREQQEAIAYAKSVAEQNRMLQERLSQGEKALVETSKAKADAMMAQAEREYQEAYEAGDTQKLIAAQKKMSEVVVEKREVERYTPQYTPPLQEPQVAVEQQLPQIVPDERTRQWVSQNEWFENDSVMRGAAFGIHDQLVREGYKAGSDAYFEQVDARIRDVFPQRFGVKKPAANVVAPATRSSSGSKKIVLTKSQVAVAKRLGVPLEKYAEQLAKEMNNV